MGNGKTSSKHNCWRGRKVEREFGPAQRKAKENQEGKPHTSAMHVRGQGISHVTRCPARGKACAKCGRKGHWAICCSHEKFRFSRPHMACFLKMTSTLSFLCRYNFRNFPYSGLILPFVLRAMRYLLLV